MKRFFKLFLTFCFAFTLFSCGEKSDSPNKKDPVKLETPVISEAFGKIVKWNEVNLAATYNVNIDGSSIVHKTIDKNSIELHLSSGEYTLKVQALPETYDGGYTNSDWSEVISFSFDENSGIYNKETALELVNYNLGSSINPLNDIYLNKTTVKHNFIDTNKLSTKFSVITKDKITKTPYIKFDNNNGEKFAYNLASTYLNSNGIDLGLADELKNNFGFTNNLPIFKTNSIERNANTKESFYLGYKAIPDTRKYIKDFDTQVFKDTNLLSNDATKELEKMKDLKGDALDNAINELIKTFGTHIVTDATYGAKIETSYYAKTNDATLEDINVLYAYIYNVLEKEKLEDIKIPNDPNAIDPMFNIDNSKANIATKFGVRVFGGEEFEATSIKDLSSKYDTWLESYNDELDHTTMIEINHGGLTPIWKLLPNEYSKIARRMETIFKNAIRENNTSFLDDYKVKDTYTDDYTNFAGGNGTINHPYVISDVTQLNKIREDKFNTSNTYFELSDDINLSQKKFEPIFKFNGHLDGNNHVIKNFEFLSEGQDVKYIGLILNNKGTIKNLHLVNEFNKPNISLVYSPSKVDSKTILIGGLVALNDGTISNCHTTNTNIYANLKSAYGYNHDTLNCGGIVGANNGLIEYSSTDGFNLKVYHKCNDLQKNANINTAGGAIASWNTPLGTIENCYAANSNQYIYGFGTYSNAWDNGTNHVYIANGGIVGQNDHVVKNVYAYNGTISSQYDHIGSYYVVVYTGGKGRYIGVNNNFLLDSAYVDVEKSPIVGEENGITKNDLLLEKDEDIVNEYNYEDFLYYDKESNSIKFRYLDM